jgi:prepilin-type N-terminal cleavage/methylation domain-containing protein
MKKRSNKGFTLVEVILSLAIFSIISVGFLGMFSSVYINTFKSTVVTENAFLAQRQIEDQIATVKSSLEMNIPPTGLTSTTVTLFSGSNLRSVVVYHLRQSVTTDQVIDTLVASSRPPQLLVPNITSTVTIAAFSGTTKKDYPNIGMPSLSVDLGTPLVVDNPGLLIRYLYYWYISNSRINIPGNYIPGEYITNNPPFFPDNYEIIAEHTTNLIPSIPASYAGRFLKLVVTPVGEKGQMGTSVVSNDLYISALPVNDNLIFNLDANYINTSDITNQVRQSGTDIYVKKWQDISASVISPVQATNGSQPILLKYNVGTTEQPQYTMGMEKLLPIVTGTTAWNLKTASASSIINKANMTVYFAAMIDPTIPQDFLLFESNAGTTAGNRWTLGIENAITKKLVLTRYLASATSPFIVRSTDSSYANGTYRFFKLEIFQNKLSISVDGVDVGTLTPTATTTTMNLTDFRINLDENFTISEIVVYDSIHTPAQTDAMNAYFNAKYNP